MITIQFNDNGTYQINGVSSEKARNLYGQEDFNVEMKYVLHWINNCKG